MQRSNTIFRCWLLATAASLSVMPFTCAQADTVPIDSAFLSSTTPYTAPPGTVLLATLSGNINRQITAQGALTIDTAGYNLSSVEALSSNTVVTKAGAGTFTYNNSSSSAFAVTGGTLGLGYGATGVTGLSISQGATANIDSIRTFVSDIGVNGTLSVSGFKTDTTLAGNISGTGAITIDAFRGTTTLTGTNTFTGIITNNSSLIIGNGSTSGSIVTSIVNNGGVGFFRSDDITYAGNIIGGSVTQMGTGTLTVTGTITGMIVNPGGKLQIGNGGTTGAITGTLFNKDTVTFNRSDNYTVTAKLSATAGAVYNVTGGGTASLVNSMFYGIFVVAPGSTLQFGDGGAPSSIDIDSIVNNGTVVFNNSGVSQPGSVLGFISGTGSVVKTGSGTRCWRKTSPPLAA